MPTQTFFNLPDAKRNRIIEVAIEEFAAHPYSKASLSKIVAKAGIAKGSMYQYFNDKFDLYQYLFDVAVQKKLTYIQEQNIAPDLDFFTMLEQVIIGGLRFGLDHPKLSQVFANANDARSDQAVAQLIAKGKQMSKDYMLDMVVKAQREGKLREDLKPALVVQILLAVLGEGLTEYLFDKLGVTRQEFMVHPALSEQLSMEEILEIIHDVLQVLRKGLEC